MDRVAQDLSVKVIRGEVALPNRSTTDTYFTADTAVRSALHPVFDGVP